MKILISTLDDQSSEREVEVGELNYEREEGNFWMRCVMGDDWFQRVNSCASLDFTPKAVRFSSDISFVVFDNGSQVEQFENWLKDAESKVREGFRTMRG